MNSNSLLILTKKKKKILAEEIPGIYLLQVNILVACRETVNKILGGSGAGKQNVQYPQLSHLLLNASLADPSCLKVYLYPRSELTPSLHLKLPRLYLRRRQWQPTPVLLSGKSHGWRSLVGCSPWGPWESDTTEQLHFRFSLLCTGEGNGNPFQCSCLENPRDGGAWWAAVYGVAQSWT